MKLQRFNSSISVLKKYHLDKLLLIACLILILLISLAGCNSYTNPSIRNLDITMTLNKDGSVNITEVHKVEFDSRSSEDGGDWWNYYKVIDLNDNNKGNEGNTRSVLSGLSVTVDGTAYPVNQDLSALNLNRFSDSNKKKYAGNSYQSESASSVEIGVVLSEFSASVKEISFSYTLSNVMINYADCSGLYYKFVSDNNSLAIKAFTAKVNFAEAVGSEEEIAVWTHIDTGSAGNYLDTNTLKSVSYQGESIPDETYLETRILFADGGYVSQKNNSLTFQEIVAEENAWKESYEKEILKAKIVTTIDAVICPIVIIGAILLSITFKKKRKPKLLDDAPEYYRDIPEGWTAGEMAPLYHYYGKFDVSDSISATIMELCRRGYINIQVGEKKKEAEITIKNLSSDRLRGHEVVVLKMLNNVATSCGQPFTMKDMEKYAKKHYNMFASDVDDYKRAANIKTETMGCYPTKSDDASSKFIGKFILGFGALGILILINTFIIGIGGLSLIYAPFGLIVGSIIMTITNSKTKLPLPEIGQRQYNIFNALGKFMTEFSTMDDKSIPELVMWEEFMVYATAMGIADKVSEQIEIAYPEYKEMVNSAYNNNGRCDNTFLILYLMSPRVRMGTSFTMAATMRNINSNVNNLVRQAKIQANAKKFGGGSGGHFGGGGGFSGGGGGFGGGGMGAR